VTFQFLKAFSINTTMPVSWRDILDATVKVLFVVSPLEHQRPFFVPRSAMQSPWWATLGNI
jgi:hypothetical protein